MPDGGLRMCACDEYPAATPRGDLDVDVAADSVRTPPANPEMAREFLTRAYAENPMSVYPAPGDVRLWHPPGGPGVRVDSHLYSGYYVPPFYDSLVAKIIAHGEDRDTSIARMRNALSEMVVEGIKTNTPLHQEIFGHSAFHQGSLDIHYLERRLGLK